MSLDLELQNSPLVQLQFYQLLKHERYAGMVLGTEQKKFVIYGDASLVYAFKNEERAQQEIFRPLTHDLIDFICQGFQIACKHVLIYAYKNQVFYTKLVLEQKQSTMTFYSEIDARPSDSIPYALQTNAPILCTCSVFEQIVPYETVSRI